MGWKTITRTHRHTYTPAPGTDRNICSGKKGGGHVLLARAWLADNAVDSIDVQYFIWSTDNIGVLAAESLLRAAERGVKVIVDDGA